MPALFDLVTAGAIGAYWTESAANKIPYLGETLFPARKKIGLDLSWIKGRNGLPAALRPSHFDAKPQVRDRIGVSEVKTEMPFFRESMTVKEKDRQQMLQFQASNDQYAQIILGQVYNDAAGLVDGALVQSERIRMQLLADGAVNISDGTLGYEYNFDPDGEYAASNKGELAGTARWSQAQSNPVTAILEIQDKIEETTGTRPTRAVMSRKTWGYLLSNAAIKGDMSVRGGDKLILTDALLQQYLMTKLGLAVEIYSKKYRDEAGDVHPFYPDDQVTFLPEGALGTTWYGTTPEEADLLSEQGVQVSIVNTGVAVKTYKEVNPVNIVTTVSQIVMPSFERMDETYILKVA
ncbi:MAG: major capsid protein [Peptococcaceae bacterium]|jgi:hypothetical protein|nr:major capsid protein [Peptococcaceae bacterium]